MALTTSQAGALVKGAPAAKPKFVQLEVSRPFCIAGVRKEVGDVVEVSESLARELVSIGKAIAYVAKPAPAKPAAAPKEKQA